LHPPNLASKEVDETSSHHAISETKEVRGSQTSRLPKKKNGQRALLLDEAEKLLTALFMVKEKRSSLQSHSQVPACMVWRFCMVATVFPNGYKHASRQTRPHQQVAHTHRQKIKDMLPNRIVGYSPDLARMVGGATTGLYLSQLLFLSDKGANPEGWVYKSEQEMGRETGLTKREQQTARRKLLSLGVIAIMRGGWKNTYHFRVIWEKLYQVIAGFQRPQNVPTEKSESAQNVPTEPVQNVVTQPAQWQQNVSTKWKQNGGTLCRENDRENKEAERTDRENQTIWENAREQIKKDLTLGETADRLAGTTLVEVSETAALIFVPNRFAIPWLERRLYGQITKALKGVVGRDVDLQFVTSPH
jgi:hypothetical protein